MGSSFSIQIGTKDQGLKPASQRLAPGPQWQMRQGQQLLSGPGGGQPDQELQSQCGRFTFRMQHDANVVLYKHGAPIWASNTWAQWPCAPYRIVVQDDGNLVAYDGDGKPIWASDTCHQGRGPYRLDMQTDGNCVLYDADRRPIWSTDTWRHGSQ